MMRVTLQQVPQQPRHQRPQLRLQVQPQRRRPQRQLAQRSATLT